MWDSSKPPSEEQFKEFANVVNGGVDMTFGELAGLRRVHFEASAIVMAELKSKATEPSGEAGRKLPVAEKNGQASRPGGQTDRP